MSYNQRKFINDLKSVVSATEQGSREGSLKSVYSTYIHHKNLQGDISNKIVNRYEVAIDYQGYSIARLFSWFDVEKDTTFEFLLLTSNGYGDAITTRMRIRDVLDTLYNCGGAPYLLYKKGVIDFQYAGSKHKIPWRTTSNGVKYIAMKVYSSKRQLVVYSNAHWSKFIGLNFWTPARIEKVESEFNS